MSARLNRCTEDVRVQALVIAKLKLVDVQMQVLLADLVERADDSALHDGPKAFDGVGMNGSTHIFPSSMMNHAMRNFLVQKPITLMIVRRKQTDMMGDGFMDEAIQRGSIGAFNHASDHVASKIPASALAFMLILGLPADIGFIDFDIADELLKLDIAKGYADLAAHQPCSFVGAKAHISADLQRADPLLAREHEMHDAEPFTQWLVGILEDRPDQQRKAIGVITALLTLPVPFHVMQFMDLLAATTRTRYAFWPAVTFEIFPARIFMRELFLKLYNRHLVNLEKAFRFLHGLVSLQSGASMPC